MAGGTPEHALLAARALIQIGGQLAGGACAPFTSDFAVELEQSGT